MKKLLFSGCSFTAGTGWVESDLYSADRTHPDLWTNLVWKNIDRFKDLSLENIGCGGISNTEIFENTVQAIANHDIDTIFCQWTSMPRYTLKVGFELWDTKETLFHDDRSKRKHDIKLSNGDHWTRKYIDDILDRFRALHHLHWEILKVVRYTNTIKRLCEKSRINVFFVNGLCPWDHDYFTELKDCKPESYTKFTKAEILNIDTRDDQDIYKLYSLAHQHYKDAGGVQESDWINLYDSYRTQQIDTNFDQNHPGKQSNQLYSSIVENRLKQLNFI